MSEQSSEAPHVRPGYRADGSPPVSAGYRVFRDDRNLTENERQVMGQLAMGKNQTDAGKAIGLSRQRVHQLVQSLESKGYVKRAKGRLEIVVAKGDSGE